MRSETMGSDAYRYRLYYHGKRIDTGSAVDTEQEALRQLNNRMDQRKETSGTIERRSAGSSRFAELYQVDRFEE